LALLTLGLCWGRTPWRWEEVEEAAVHLGEDSKQSGTITGMGWVRYALQRHAPSGLLSATSLLPQFIPLLSVIFKFQIHQWFKPFIRSEPSWSNCLWKLSHRHTQRCGLLISQAFLNAINFTIMIFHHTSVFSFFFYLLHISQILVIVTFQICLKSFFWIKFHCYYVRLISYNFYFRNCKSLFSPPSNLFTILWLDLYFWDTNPNCHYSN
jgi:hypothetical protein